MAREQQGEARACLSRYDAREIFGRLGIAPETDFFTLSASQVGAVLDAADGRRYRKPKHANGSRARYFYAFLQRAARSMVRP